MVKLHLILSLFGAALLAMPIYGQAASSETLTPEQQDVLKPLRLMCDGLVKKDARLIQDQLLPGGMATQIRNGKPVQMHFDFFDARLKSLFEASDARFEETLYHPTVNIDHDVAVIWAPYVFTVNGKMDHCGTNIFTLYRKDGRWLVSNVADTGRQDSCPSN